MSHIINFFPIFILNINLKLSSLSIISEIQKTKICYKSDSTGLSEDTYQDFQPNNPEKGNDENLLSMIFLNDEGNSKYFKQHIAKYDKINLILYLILAISIIIFIDFNIHFFCKIQKRKESIKRNRTFEKNGMNKMKNSVVEKTSKLDLFFDFFKISPFCWINYFFMKEVESKLYFTKYETKKLTKINIKVKYIFSVISILLILLTASFALMNLLNNSNGEKSIYNLSCDLVVLSNKLIDGNNNYIGLTKANEFFNGLNEKKLTIESYKKEFNRTYNELQNKFSEWNSFLIKLNNTLSDQNSMEFFFYNYPSTPYYSDSTNLSDCEQFLYQYTEIYAYYPLENTEKHLNKINVTFFNSFGEVIKNVNDLDKILIQPNNSKLLVDENGLYHQIIKKSYQIVEFYTKEFLAIFIPEIYDDILDNYLPFISYMDIIIFILTLLILVCFVFFCLYLFSLFFMKNKLFIAIVFYLLLFLLNFLSIFEFSRIQKIKQKMTYVEDIYNGIYFLLNKNNLAYYANKPSIYIKNISLEININNEKKNVLYYLNQIINNNGNITNLYPINTSISKKSEIDEFYTKFNKMFLPSSSIFTQKYTNSALYKIKTHIDNLSNNGIVDYSPFRKLNESTSVNQRQLEMPYYYFSIINGRLDKEQRNKHSLKDFDCNEYWDIYGTGYTDNYIYMPKSEAIRQNYGNQICINHYSNHAKTRVLNYVDYSFYEIMERYSDLKDQQDLDRVYNLIFYEFTAVETLRGEKVKEQFAKVKNFNTQLENDEIELIDLLKNCSVLAYEIMSIYKNIFDDYIENEQELYSFLNCDFIKNDLNYLLSEAENSLVVEFRKLYNNHFYLFLAVVVLEFDLILYYVLSAYDLFKIKEIKEEENIIERIKKEINWSREIQFDQDAMSADGNRKIGFNDGKTHNTFVFRGFEDKQSIHNILKLKKNSNATNQFFKNIFGYKQTQKNKQPILNIVIQGKNGEILPQNQVEGDSDQSKVSIISKEKDEDLMPTNKLCINKPKQMID